MINKLYLFMIVGFGGLAAGATAGPSRASVCMSLLEKPSAQVARADNLDFALATSFQSAALEWARMNARLKEFSTEARLKIYAGPGHRADPASLGMFMRAVHSQNFAAVEIRGEAEIRQTISDLTARAREIESTHPGPKGLERLARPAKIALGTLPALVTAGLLVSKYYSINPSFDLAVESGFGSLFALTLGGGLLHSRDQQVFTEFEIIESYLDAPKPDRIMYSVLRLPKVADMRSGDPVEVVGQILRRLAGSHVLEHFGEVVHDLLRRYPPKAIYIWQLFGFDAHTGEPVWWLGLPEL